jgi:hypothetical protein
MKDVIRFGGIVCPDEVLRLAVAGLVTIRANGAEISAVFFVRQRGIVARFDIEAQQWFSWSCAS